MCRSRPAPCTGHERTAYIQAGARCPHVEHLPFQCTSHILVEQFHNLCEDQKGFQYQYAQSFRHCCCGVNVHHARMYVRMPDI